ncbi:MAG: ERCC4 domain-containing protein [Candidatus Norongarragalinales archaeon]
MTQVKRERINELVFDEALLAQNKVQVFVDDREAGGECAEALRALGVVVRVQRLEVGDFVVSERCAIERKTSSDFESSVIDGRLFTQASELKDNFLSPLICVVGNRFAVLKPKALRGALMALCVDQRVPVLFFEDDSALAEFVAQLAEREQLTEPKEMRLRVSKKNVPLAEQQLFFVQGLPGVGAKNARALLSHFKTIEELVNANEKELCEVDGIGKKRAREIKRLLSSDFEPAELNKA